jgi:hypothetical protein
VLLQLLVQGGQQHRIDHCADVVPVVLVDAMLEAQNVKRELQL